MEGGKGGKEGLVRQVEVPLRGSGRIPLLLLGSWST